MDADLTDGQAHNPAIHFAGNVHMPLCVPAMDANGVAITEATNVGRTLTSSERSSGTLVVHERPTRDGFFIDSPRFVNQFHARHEAVKSYIRPLTD